MAVVSIAPQFSNVDPLAETKTVIWRPDTAATVIKEGQPVCYDSDCVHDAQERTTNPSSDGATYAEGSQNFTGRFLTVEEPQTDNLVAFAGIVASLGPLAGADGDTLRIYVPKEGSVVPVRTDLNCLADQTIMGIRNGSADVGYAPRNTGKSIGVALEDKDRSTTAGLVWMRFGGFHYDNPNEALSIDDAANGQQITVNDINVKSLQTSGSFTALKIRAESSAGAGTNSQRGMALQAVTIVSGTNAGSVHGATIEMEITGGTPIEYLFPLHVKLYESGATAMTSIACMGVLNLCCQVADEPSGNDFCWIYAERHGTCTPDSFIRANAKGDLSDAAMTGDHVFDANDRCIPVRFQGSSEYFYIPLMNNKGD